MTVGSPQLHSKDLYHAYCIHHDLQNIKIIKAISANTHSLHRVYFLQDLTEFECDLHLSTASPPKF
ncbi:MAG: hypothetical protein CMF51_03190 [Legionellales bacterium]|nr:hypothetical protein [Legionellales bacterium]